jgi:hypothetical protein
METKHLVIGILVFALIGVGIFYLGSMLSSIESTMQTKDPITPSVGEVLQAVDEAQASIEEAKKQQDQSLKAIGY